MSLSEETGLSRGMGRGRSTQPALRKRGIDSGQFQGKAKGGRGGTPRPHPCPPGPLALPLEAWALVSLRVSIAFKKAECALLLPGGQWTIALFLKDWAGWWRRGGNKSDPASLGRPRAATSISGQPRRKSREAHFLPNRPQITVPVMCIF